MLFNSWEFAVFFPIVTALYFLVPHRTRWALLLAASCLFYAVFVPTYILILGVTIVVDYFAGLLLEAYPRHKRSILWVSIVSNAGFLFFFKYFNFCNANVTALADWLGWHNPVQNLDILLPIGLSFHTFQAMSYTIEVYRGAQRAERHFGIYALYVMFYPQLVAGPIERPQNMLHQFHERHYFDEQRVVAGLRMMLWGLFKKAVIADRLAAVVDVYFQNPAQHGGLTPFVAMLFYAFQVYCDFSGYCDIALGSAKVMGFTLMQNFNSPYFSRSIGEFWRRWHISLSTWFRDYVYVPLGGSQVAGVRWARNIAIVFLLSGLWHGANWTFVVWGGLHAVYLIGGKLTLPFRTRIAQFTGITRVPVLLQMWQTAVTFMLVTLGWVFFRAQTLTDGLTVLQQMGRSIGLYFRHLRHRELGLWHSDLASICSWVELWSCLGLIGLLVIVEAWQRDGRFPERLSNKPVWLRWSAYQMAVLAIVLFGVFHKNQFIYFQF